MNFIDQVYPRRPGSHDWGRDYEIKVTALIALRCIGLKDTKDLWLGSNVDCVGDFDDVVLCRWTNDNLCNVYLIQLKHQENPKNIEQRDFTYSSTTKKKKFKEDFALTKYYSGYIALKENLCNSGKGQVPEIIRILHDAHNIAFILATNRNVNRCDLLQNVDNSELDFLDTSQSSNSKFQFCRDKFSYDLEFLDWLFLFVNQVHVSELDRMIEKELKKLLETSKNVASKFVAFVMDWLKGFGINEFYVLTKNDIINKLTDLLLDPYKFDFSKDSVTFYSTDSCKNLWNGIVQDKVVSFVDVDEGILGFLKEFIGCEVMKQVTEPKTLWSDHLSKAAQKCFSKAKLLSCNEQLALYDVYKWLWSNCKLPLLLNVKSVEDYEDVMKIIRLSGYRLHFIVIIVGSVEMTLKRSKKIKFLHCFHDLNKIQQSELLNLSVWLQGRTSIKLQSLVEANMYDFIRCRDIINILSGDYQVGYKYNNLMSYCITPLLLKIFLKSKVLEELADEVFVVDSKVDKIPWDLPNVYDDTRMFLELQDEYDSVHRLFFHKSGQLEWKESFGSTQNIRKYQLINKDLKNNSFESLTNSVHIISANPGMGKSILIDYVAVKCPDPVWILKIDLNEHEDYTDVKYFDDFNLKRYNCANPELSKLVFEHLLQRKEVLVLLDGFDEIFISYKEEVINFSKQLRNADLRVWLTTRPFAGPLLEDEFDTISVTLKPFDRIEQQTFLMEYFKVPDCRPFVEKLLKATEENLTDLEFMGVPLQLKLLADVFQKDVEQVEFNCNFNLAYLYGEFFKQKADILCSKYGKGAKEMRILFDKIQKLGALKIILPSLYLAELDVTHQLAQCYENDQHSLLFLQREGVVVLEPDKQRFTLQFVHRTFASYLVAKWLMENLSTNKGAARCVSTFFSNSYYKFEFRMFNCILANDCSLHMALTMGRIEEAKALIKSNPKTIRAIDKCGRSVIHIIALHGINHDDYDDDELGKTVVDKMVEVIDEIPSKKIKDIEDLVGYRALDYAIEGQRMAVANKLLEKIQNISIRAPICGNISFFRYCFKMGYKFLFNRVILPYFASQDLLIENLGDQPIHTYCENLTDLDNFDEYINDLNAKTILDLFRSKTGYHNVWIAAGFGTKADVLPLLENLDLNKKDANGFTLLHYAARHGKLEIVKLLISIKVDVNVLSGNGETPLHCAAKMGHNDIVSYLLSKGAQIDIQTKYGDTPLLAALSNKHLTIARLLISKGANVTIGCRNEKTNLHHAIVAGDYDIVNHIISKGADVNQKTNFNETPLLLACQYKHPSIAKLLLDNEITNIVERDYYGSSPLHYAATIEDVHLMSDLIAKGCAVNAQNNCGETPLIFAVKYKNSSAVKYLLNNNANVNLGHDENGWTCLHHAATINDVDTTTQLLSKGAKLNQHNKNRETPLFTAISNKAVDVAKFLISESAEIQIEILLYMASFGEDELLSEVLSKVSDVNGRNTFGESALLLALRYNRIRTAQILLSFGVDIDVKNMLNQNSLHYIIKYARFSNEEDVDKQITIAKALLNCKSNNNSQDYEGYTPFHVFAGKLDKHKTNPILFEKFQEELFKAFVDCGCDVNLKNKMGESALELAVSLNNTKFVAMFKQFFVLANVPSGMASHIRPS